LSRPDSHFPQIGSTCPFDCHFGSYTRWGLGEADQPTASQIAGLPSLAEGCFDAAGWHACCYGEVGGSATEPDAATGRGEGGKRRQRPVGNVYHTQANPAQTTGRIRPVSLPGTQDRTQDELEKGGCYARPHDE
jgi:hypothetical protein